MPRASQRITPGRGRCRFGWVWGPGGVTGRRPAVPASTLYPIHRGGANPRCGRSAGMESGSGWTRRERTGRLPVRVRVRRRRMLSHNVVLSRRPGPAARAARPARGAASVGALGPWPRGSGVVWASGTVSATGRPAAKSTRSRASCTRLWRRQAGEIAGIEPGESGRQSTRHLHEFRTKPIDCGAIDSSLPGPECGVEQLGARRAHNPEVAGSSPAPAISEQPAWQ
jgi:hypothetical protein